MAIKVHIPTGETSVTVKGLYQWDYGQVLEIECEEIGSEILEAHFACSNMPEAVVRICSFSAGVGTVLVPDECLEQTSPVSVWLCRSDSTQRHTIKTIVLPLTTRTRPSNTRDVPVDYTDTFGLLIEEVNEAIDALENGNVTADKARTATTAGSATTAVSAANATYATSAGHANSAGTANDLVALYHHSIKLTMPVYLKTSDTSPLGTVILHFDICSPQSNISSNSIAWTFLLANAGKRCNYFGKYINGTNEAIVSDYMYKGNDGTWTTAYIYMGNDELTIYYKEVATAVSTIKIY